MAKHSVALAAADSTGSATVVADAPYLLVVVVAEHWVGRNKVHSGFAAEQQC